MIFDSDILIWYVRGDSEAAAWLDASAERAMSVVTWMEVLQGTRSKADMKSVQQSFRNLQLRVLPLTETIGQRAAALIEEHTLASGLQVADALIAATAIESGEVLATSNIRHFDSIRHLALKPFRPRRG